jgi:hypothetical protein
MCSQFGFDELGVVADGLPAPAGITAIATAVAPKKARLIEHSPESMRRAGTIPAQYAD